MTKQHMLAMFLVFAGCSAASEPEPALNLFTETWEEGAGAWRAVDSNPIIIAGDATCDAYQRETVPYSGGRVYTRASIPVEAGVRYCVSAWVRVESGTTGYGVPFIGVQDALPDGTPSGAEVWPIGLPGYTSGAPVQTAVGVGTDSAWHWYRALFDLDAQAQAVVLKDETFSPVGAADFAAIQLFANGCPSPPAAVCQAD